MAKICPYFVSFFILSSAMPFKKRLICTNFISFSVKNKKSRWVQITLSLPFYEKDNSHWRRWLLFNTWRLQMFYRTVSFKARILLWKQLPSLPVWLFRKKIALIFIVLNTLKTALIWYNYW